MAINKRKILDAAQKFLQKGALEKALKEYNKLLEADPQDANVRLKYGDVQLRLGNAEAAVDEYLRVAQQFMKEGFDAKAVALFKQVTKISPNRYEVYEPLAELYQRLGLLSEAMNALQTAAESFQRDGRKREGLEALRKMATLDPTNTGSRLKIADMLWKAELQDEALAEFDEVAAELARQGDNDGVVRVLEQTLALVPERIETIHRLSRALVDVGRLKEAERRLEQLTSLAPDLVEAWELRTDVLQNLGRTDALEDAYRTLADLYQDRGDEERAREIRQRFVASEPFEAEASAAEAGPAPSVAEDESQAELTAEADPAQLLAEASVYLRYGQHAKAIGCLEAALESEPENRSVLEKLGEACAGAGNAARAVEVWNQALKLAQDENDSDAVEAIRASIDGLASTESPAEASTPEPAADAPEIELDAGDADADLDLDVSELGDDLDLDAPLDGEEGSDELEYDEADLEKTVTLSDLDLDAQASALESEAPAEAATGDENFDVEIDILIDEEDSVEASADADEATSDIDDITGDAAPQTEAAPPTAEPAADAAAQLCDEELEEVQFYVQQGLFNEAEEMLRRMLEAAPEHPELLLRLSEIAQARGESATAPAPDPSLDDAVAQFDVPRPEPEPLEELEETPDVEPDPDPEPEPESEPESDLVPEVDAALASDVDEAPTFDDIPVDELEELPEIDFSGDVDLSTDSEAPIDAAAEEPESDASESQIDISAEVEFDFDASESEDSAAELSAGDLGEAIDEPEEIAAEEADEPVEEVAEAQESTPEDEAILSEPEEVDAEADALFADAEVEDEAGFDLAAELSDAMEETAEVSPLEQTLGTTREGFEAIFDEFKQGVNATLGEGDHETHYDLGIAYREMGLIEDAMGEFRTAMAAPGRRLDCLHMIGQCEFDLGQFAQAVTHFEEALALPDVSETQRVALGYHLGRAFEEQGNTEAALASFREVSAADSSFCDVSQRIAALSGEGPPVPEAPDDGYESFEDLIAEAKADDD